MNDVTLLLSTPGGSEWILILLGIAIFIFWIKTIIEIATGRFKDDTSKIAWLLVVIFVGIIGAVIYTFVGRRSRLAA